MFLIESFFFHYYHRKILNIFLVKERWGGKTNKWRKKSIIIISSLFNQNGWLVVNGKSNFHIFAVENPISVENNLFAVFVLLTFISRNGVRRDLHAIVDLIAVSVLRGINWFLLFHCERQFHWMFKCFILQTTSCIVWRRSLIWLSNNCWTHRIHLIIFGLRTFLCLVPLTATEH